MTTALTDNRSPLLLAMAVAVAALLFTSLRACDGDAPEPLPALTPCLWSTP